MFFSFYSMIHIFKKHPYIAASIAAILVAVVAWMLVPKTYGAQVKISDEYKETDLSIGLNQLNVLTRDLAGDVNKGVNDIEVYWRILKSEEMAQTIARTQVPGKGIDYAHYLAEPDTLEAITRNISYNISAKQQTLTVQFADHDPVVAAQMLDSVMMHLQNTITAHRRDKSLQKYQAAMTKRHLAGQAYHKALNDYANYVDTHVEQTLPSEQKQADALKEEIDKRYNDYNKAVIECERYKMLSKRSYLSYGIIKSNMVPTQATPYLIGYVLLALFIALLSVKACKLYATWKRNPVITDFGSATSPWCITLVVWGSLMIAMQFRDPTWLNAPSSQFYTSLCLWLVFFCPVSFITYTLLPCNTTDRQQIQYQAASPIHMNKIGIWMFYFLFTISVIITPLFIKRIMDIVMMFGTEDLMLNMRNLAVYGNQQSFLNYAIVVNETLMIVALWAYPQVKKWVMTVACLSSLANSIAIMEKGGMLLVIFCIVFILYQRSYIKIRTIAVLAVVLILLSYGFNLMRESKDTIDYQNDDSIFNFIAMYLLSPPVAYCTLTRELVPQFGGHTFPLVYLFLIKQGMGNYVFFDRLQEFVFVPVSTNVYTIFQPFYMDFGQFGVAIFAVVYGVLTGWAYRQMRNGVAFGKCFYMYIAYCLIFQFFQEYIFTGNMHIVQLIVFLFICTQDKFNITLRKPQIRQQ